MQNRPSSDPRDSAIRAALRDAATLSALVDGEFQATYDGSDRATYLKTLRSWLADLGGVVDDDGFRMTATLDGRRIAIHFGPVSGHR